MDLIIKLIQVGNEYKALVLDLSRKGNRVLFIAENASKDVAWDLAEQWVKSNQPDSVSLWH